MDAGKPPPHDAGVDAGWAPVPEAQWCHAQATARCWRDLRCGRIDGTLVDDCIARTEITCDTSAYVTSGMQGRHTYDPMQAAKCLDGYDWGSCELLPSDCNGVFIGRTGPDAGALVPEDCDRDAGFFNAYENTCPHHCIGWAPLGAPCFDNLGRFPPSCQTGIAGCEYVPDAGEDVCVPAHKENDACSGFYSCNAGLTCTDSKCVKETAATGEPCRTSNGYPFCGADDFCRQPPPDAMGNQPPGVCERRVGLHGVCAGYGTCFQSLRCTSMIGTGTCERRLGVGEPCSNTFTDECEAGLWCPNDTSRCTALPGDGGDCSFNGTCNTPYYSCAVGYACSQYPDYICIPRVPDGQPCGGYDEVCLSNECQYGMFPDAGYGYRFVRCSQMADGG